MQAEALQHLFGAGGHPLVLVARLLGGGDRDQLHLAELMLADHAARVLACRARLGAEAERAGGEAQRQRRFSSTMLSRTRLVIGTSAVGMSQNCSLAES